MEITRHIKEITLSGEFLEKIEKSRHSSALIKAINDNLTVSMNEIVKKKCIISDKGYYFPKISILLEKADYYSNEESKKDFYGIPAKILNYKSLVYIANNVPEDLKSAIISSPSIEKKHWIEYENGYFAFEDGQRGFGWTSDKILRIRAVEITKDRFREFLCSNAIKLKDSDNYSKCVIMYAKAVKGREITSLTFSEIEELAQSIGIEKDKINVKKELVINKAEMMEYKSKLKRCDTDRIGLEEYPEKKLEDINEGHWELWDDTKKDGVRVKLKSDLIARNPCADVGQGLIGIDFGTKSTIVSHIENTTNVDLFRIGVGNLSRAAKEKDYENPTIIEFIHLDKFLRDYHAEKGRPHTSINDLTVSHKAANSFINSQSDLFYSFFYDIKQWCGDSGRYKQIKLISKDKKEYILPPYLELKENDIDPVEIYAYFLGLYINNMWNGIYINYLLSFPVTYENKVKEKLQRSFERGIKKSLPQAVLENEEIMKKFYVKQGISEPAAYAICALQNYGFEPAENEKIFYGIFDFGGGTSDFDFGEYRLSEDNREEERYDYVIEHFGSEGSKFLGGENLLELLSYETVKANKEIFFKNSKGKEKNNSGFSFTKPSYVNRFAGSETIISQSQEAKRNTKQLMEALRPIWEGIVGYELKENTKDLDHNLYKDEESGYILDIEDKSIITNKQFKVSLYDNSGNLSQDITLNLKNVDIFGILEREIRNGVNEFFDSLKNSFHFGSKKKIDKIHIFMAGNASKSPILKKCFDEKIDKLNKEINKSIGNDNHFELYPPLGTKQAREIQKSRGIVVDEDNITSPTGKTGVAYGLLAGKLGVLVKGQQSEKKEARFGNYVGKNKRGKLQVVLDKNIEYKKWERFIGANEEEFYIYYSSSPMASSGNYLISECMLVRCMLDSVSDGDVYIRAISPTEIEYAVFLSEEDVKNKKPQNNRIVKINLGK